MKLVECIASKNFDEANSIIEEKIETIMAQKLAEMKKMVGIKMVEEVVTEEDEEQLDEARFKIIKARVRGGKVQRRKKVSTVKGYTFRGGKLTRMSVTERRKRKMGQRRGKIKRKSKMSRALIKRKRSMRKRMAIGLR